MAETGRKLSRSKERLQTKQSNMQHSEPGKTRTKEYALQDLVWKDLNEEQVLLLISLTPQELEQKIVELLSLNNYHICLKEATLVDYYVSAFWFAKQVHFNNEETSAFFSLMKILLENLKDEQMSLTENISILKKYISTKSSLFSIYQKKLVSDYVMESLFQHYKLYQFVFSSQPNDSRDVCAIKEKLLVEVPPMADLPFPPPMDEGLPEEIYSEHVLGLTQSNMTCNQLDTKVQPTMEDNQGNTRVQLDKERVNDNKEETVATLLTSLSHEQIKQVLQDVSDSILNDVKIGVKKKLKERESAILSKISKK